MLTKHDCILINKIAQGILSIEDGRRWFLDVSPEKQYEILREISVYALQASARETDVPKAIEKAGLKETFTSCVLLQKGRLKMQLAKVINLPHDEHLKCFSLLIALFSIADDRRRKTKCEDSCSHWWHHLDAV